jgi:DNA-binding NarL/FixJ family response regulator
MGKPSLEVLVVEDDPIDFMSVSRVLAKSEKISYKLARAETMENGKRLLEEKDFDAVILDLGLPDAVGVDSIINFNASSPATPIVVLSGQDNLDIALGAVGVGAEDFLSKSELNGKVLEERISFALERRENRIWAMEQALEKHVHQILAEAPQEAPLERETFLRSIKGGLHALASPVIHFQKDEAIAYRLRFGLRPGADCIDGKFIKWAKTAGCLEELTLACIRRALEFSRSFPVFRLHLDLEIELMNHEYVRKILGLAATTEERERLSFFLPARFGEDYRKKAFRAAMTLVRAGIEIGIRGVGGGATVVEDIMLLRPSVIRFSPLLFHGPAEFKIKRGYLKHWIGLLKGLDVPLLADEAVRTDFTMLAEMGHTGAVLKSAK